MWAKFQSVLGKPTRSTNVQPEESNYNTQQQSQRTNSNSPRSGYQSQTWTNGQTEVMSRVLEQHPNLSHFHHNHPEVPQHSQSPPPSPSKRSIFKRGPKESDSVRAPSPSLRLLPKKLKASLPFGNGNGSQSSLPQPSDEQTRHKTNPSQETVRSLGLRTSFDLLRTTTNDSKPSMDSPMDQKFSSVRSILRGPNTPGTGQNVRFFSRDAFKVISPEESLEENFLSPPQELRAPEHTSFMDRLNQLGTTQSGTPVVMRSSPPGGHKSRPSLNGVFTPMENTNGSGNDKSMNLDEFESMDMSMSGPMAPPNFGADGSFDVSMAKQLDLPDFPPPGLGFDVDSQLLGSAIELNMSMDHGQQMTSTPCKPSNKGKDREDSSGSVKEEEEMEEMERKEDGIQQITPRVSVDETIFHAKEKIPHLPNTLHDRSQSFSFGQTVFFSMGKSPALTNPLSNAYASSDIVRPSEINSQHISTPLSHSHSSSLLESGSASGSGSGSGKKRGRSLSDTVFQNILRSPNSYTSNKLPESDINDISADDLVVYGTAISEPDPFSANANTYYTPQTMIPTTPPPGLRHTRKTSKEEGIIYSLQTQLTLQQELVGQFENDLRNRDELVEILTKKVNDMEKSENQRKSALRQWKKKVQELERACRLMEEEVDSSRQESMERSVMDEASGEALRMLHRQIASLEREKKEWVKKEEMLVCQVENLEGMVKERSEDVQGLKEMLWSRDESDRELNEGIRVAKEQIDMMGNVSVGYVDEEEMKRLIAERDQRNAGEREQYRAAEINWETEKAELMMKIEAINVDKSNLEEQIENLKQQVESKEEEYEVLQNELEAQWGHSERASEKIQMLEKARIDAQEEAARFEKEKLDIVEERDELVQKYEDLEQKVDQLEHDYNENEKQRAELESENHELWDHRECLEKEREDFDEQLEQERGRSEGLSRAIQQCEDRIAQLEQENQYNLDSITRLEENVRRRDEEITQLTQKVRDRESQAESLREELGKMKREHSRTVDEQSRALKDASSLEQEAKKQLQGFVKQKAEIEVELQSFKERMNKMNDEVDRLRRQVHDLQQESADKEVRIVQVTKQRAQDKEDIQGLNIALDAKQQELELYKRKMVAKSNAPSASRASSQQRRDSSVFENTPSTSRPPSRSASVLSDTGSETTKVTALGRSNRVNLLATGNTTVKKRVEGSLGAPPSKARQPLSTPTPVGRPSAPARSTAVKSPTIMTRSNGVKSPTTMTRSNSVKSPTSLARSNSVSSPATPVPRRRVSAEKKVSRPSITSPTSSSISEVEEKENVNDSDKTARRRSMVAVPM